MFSTLLADVGGTKTQFALLDRENRILHSFYARNSEYADFPALLQLYLEKENIDQTRMPEKAVIAVAGPVDGAAWCRMTNLSWVIDSTELCERFGFRKVAVLNDLQATAWGLTDSREQQTLRLLRGSALDFRLPVTVISPGTGLGEACIYPYRDSFVVAATEGGHKTIAPFNPQSAKLVNDQWQSSGRPVSWENWFSGSGLGNLYRALFPGQPVPDNETIGEQAMIKPESKCGQVADLLAKAVYAEAGNLLLQYLSWGGVIVAGGIPPKLEPFFTRPENVDYVHRKNEYLDRLQAVPVALCTNQNIPIRGAAVYSLQL